MPKGKQIVIELAKLLTSGTRSHTELVQATGSAADTVTRNLRKLQDARLIESCGFRDGPTRRPQRLYRWRSP